MLPPVDKPACTTLPFSHAFATVQTSFHDRNNLPSHFENFAADGNPAELKFSTTLTESSWVAIRQFPHAHTNPIYVIVDEQPQKISADSAKWCLMGVDQCWKSKQHTYDESEQVAAKAAYDHARQVFIDLIDRNQK